jgi:hypothetical protein
VVEQGFAALVAMVQAWDNSAPDENKEHEKREWQLGQTAIAKTLSAVLQKAWLLPVEQMVCCQTGYRVFYLLLSQVVVQYKLSDCLLMFISGVDIRF